MTLYTVMMNFFGVATCSGFTIAIIAIGLSGRTWWGTVAGLVTLSVLVVAGWTAFMLIIEAIP